MLGRDFPFTGFSALVTSEHSSSGSQLTILLSQASVKPCFFFPFIFVLGNEIFLYTVCLKYPYKNINGKVVAPKIQKNLTTSCCIAKVASQVFFFSWPCHKGHLSGLLLSLTLTFPMLEINLTTLTWSPPGCHLLHTSDPTPELSPSWNKRWPPPCGPSDLETLLRDIWAMEQPCQRKLTNHILWAMGQLAERQNKMTASLPFTDSLSRHHSSLLLKHICIS